MITNSPSLEVLDRASILELEGRIDRAFDNSALPTDDLYTSRWQLCQYIEAFTVYGVKKFLPAVYDRRAASGMVARLDLTKYAMKHALDLMQKHLKIKGDACVRPGPFNDEGAWELYNRSVDYADAYTIFWPLHKGKGTLLGDDTNTYFEIPVNMLDQRYWTLERLLHLDADEFNPFMELVTLFTGPDAELQVDAGAVRWGPQVYEVVSRVRISRYSLKYKLITKYAKELSDRFRTLIGEVPDWHFPWGTMAEAATYFSALYAICSYHLVSIHFGALRLRKKELGDQGLCLLTTARDLNADIERISGLSSSIIAAFTEVLTFGYKTYAPDPALQPFIPVGNDLIALPGTVILSNQWRRNMLALHSRIATPDFNAKSHVFALQMTDRIVAEVPEAYRIKTHVNLPTKPRLEEIDLVLIDPASKMVLLVELKWVLQPGDMSEIFNKEAALTDGVDQACRKHKSVIGSLPKVLKFLGCEGDGWSVNSMVVVEGFRGLPSHITDIPMVPAPAFVQALQLCKNLRAIYSAFQSPDWLPQEGVNFKMTAETQTLFGHTFLRHGFEAANVSYIHSTLPDYLVGDH